MTIYAKSSNIRKQFRLWRIYREISDINEIDGEKEYIERFQLVPVTDQIFNHQTYEQHGNRVRSTNGSPSAGDLSIQNQSSVYIQAQHAPNTNENVNGLRYNSAPAEVRYEDEAYTTNRYEYVHQQHHSSSNPQHNVHHPTGEEIKVELIRGQALHGKVSNSDLLNGHSHFYEIF